MKNAKKILCLVLAVLMCFCIVPLSVSGANAYTINGKTVRYTDFSSSPDDCWNYANNIYNKIWGQRFSNSFSDSNNSLRNLSDSQLVLNATNLKNYVTHAALGSCLRICNSDYLHGSDGWGHSQIIVQKDSNGFTVFEGGLTASPHNREKYYTWSEYCSTGWLGGTYQYIKYIKWPGASAYSSDTQKPIISNVKITNVDFYGYTVTCTVSDNKGVTRVSFPTWSNYNGQDDIRWKDGTISGNTATFRVNKTDHNNENGTYTTDIYAYDAAGNHGVVYGYTVFVDAVADLETTYNGTKYILYKASVCYADAEKYCRSKGGYLAKITTAAENAAVAQLTKKYGSWCWINGSDNAQEGVWKFSSGEKIAYTNWGSGEPNSYMGTDQDYIAMHPSGEWDDSAGLGYGFICEFPHSHSYISSVTTQPTCTKTGVRTYKCSCGASYTETIAKISHNSNTTIPAVSATCTKTGLTEGKKCSVCGTITVAQQTVAKKAHTIVTDNAVSATCTKTGLTEGKHCSVCSTVTVAQQTISTVDHTDANSDYKCDYGCGYEFEKPVPEVPDTPSDPTDNCSCNCHKSGFMGFIWKIILFFNKLFKTNKTCACGVAHY